MNEFEENIYKEIKDELVQSTIDKKVDTYFTNRNELTHYYNVGKMIVDAQGGEDKAQYGNELIKKLSEKLSNELGRGYDITTLKRMRKFFLIIEKGAPLAHQLTWTHYVALLPIKDINEFNYYVNVSVNQKLSRNKLREMIKLKEYQRLDDNTKNKLINKKELDIYDNIKNPVIINTYDKDIDKEKVEEKALKSYILRDMCNSFKTIR